MMNRFFLLAVILGLIGCAGSNENSDTEEVVVQEQPKDCSDSESSELCGTAETEDSGISTSIETVNFNNGLKLDTSDFIYYAYAHSFPEYRYASRSFPEYRFTIESYGKKREYSTYLHLDDYNKPIYNRSAHKWEEPWPTVITAALYHEGIIHFVGHNKRPIWKYQYRKSIFPSVRNTDFEQWSSDDGTRLEDIIANPGGGYFLALNFPGKDNTWYKENLAIVVKVPDVYSLPGRQWYIGGEIVVNKLLWYRNRLVVFGKKDDQLFISSFNGDDPYPYIIDTQFYYYDFPYRVLSIFAKNEFFYIRGIDEYNLTIVKTFDNPYAP